MRGGRADGREDRLLAILVAFGDDRLVQAVALPERGLEIADRFRVGTAMVMRTTPSSSARFRSRETVACETCSRWEISACFELVLVIELRDAKHHPKFVGPAHGRRSSTVNLWRGGHGRFFDAR